MRFRQRGEWESALTHAIEDAREANLTDVVLAIQNAMHQIYLLKLDSENLKTLRSILQEKSYVNQ